MTTKQKDIIQLPGDPSERAGQMLAAMEALREPVAAVIPLLEKLDELFSAAANAVDASRGITIRMGAQMPDLGRALSEIARDHNELRSLYRRGRAECFKLTDTLRSVRGL